MNFELTVYLANLPPHWNAAKKASSRGRNFEAKAWAAGQVMISRASLRLLSYQAGRAEPWPEFAAHDCEACHTPVGSGKSRGNGLPISRWSLAMLNAIGTELAPPDAAKDVALRLKELADVLESPQSNSRVVVAKADAAAAALGALDKPLRQWNGEPVRLMQRIASHAPGDSWNWEEASQRYLALSALEQTRHALSPNKDHQRIQDELLELSRQLAFCPSFAGPKDFSQDGILKYFRGIQEQLEK
jgi:hypothetical protein